MENICFPSYCIDTDSWCLVAIDFALCVCQAFICEVVYMPNACVCSFCCSETKRHSVSSAGVSGGVEANCSVNELQPLYFDITSVN